MTRRPIVQRRRPQFASLAVFGVAALLAVLLIKPPRALLAERFGASRSVRGAPTVAPSLNAFGRSGEVRVLFALPGMDVEYPLEVNGDPTRLRYSWVRLPVDDDVSDSLALRMSAPLAGDSLIAPSHPGFYRLALWQDGERRMLDSLTLSVLVPYTKKRGSTINGYRIGSYIAGPERPAGFVEIGPDAVDLPLTKHLRVSDFVTHDEQRQWPRYVALDPRLLDKLELVLSEIGRWHGGADRVRMELDVHSGFRTPLHNQRVEHAVRDSRHQYGDAADVAIDANFDGKINSIDVRLITLAVEVVEREHPDLIGGLGLYARGARSYVHIDARGAKARWQG